MIGVTPTRESGGRGQHERSRRSLRVPRRSARGGPEWRSPDCHRRSGRSVCSGIRWPHGGVSSDTSLAHGTDHDTAALSRVEWLLAVRNATNCIPMPQGGRACVGPSHRCPFPTPHQERKGPVGDLDWQEDADGEQVARLLFEHLGYPQDPVSLVMLGSRRRCLRHVDKREGPAGLLISVGSLCSRSAVVLSATPDEKHHDSPVSG